MNQVNELQILVAVLSGAIVFILFLAYLWSKKVSMDFEEERIFIEKKHDERFKHYYNELEKVKENNTVLININARLIKFNDHYFKTVINDIPFDKYPEESDKAAQKQYKSILTNANRLIEEGKLTLQQTRKLAQLRIDANEIVNSNISTSTCGSPKPRTVASSEPLDSEDKTQYKVVIQTFPNFFLMGKSY